MVNKSDRELGAGGEEKMKQASDTIIPASWQRLSEIAQDMLDQADLEAEYVDLLQLRMGGHDFLLPVKDAAEIVRPIPLTPVPMAPGHLLGMANIHGQIICVIEPSKQLSLPEAAAPDSDATRFIVLRHNRMRVAIRVDAVPAIHRVHENDLKTLTETNAASLCGRLDVQDVTYDVLDAQALLQE
ncbi:MAG: chemotaxis protein CheW [Mariprofundaceae bacterium]